MHPLICILSFLSFSISLALSQDAIVSLSLGAVLIGCAYLYGGPEYRSGTWAKLRRMRWFFMSIFIFYFWMTPGPPLFPYGGQEVPWWMPTFPGFESGLYRVAVLAAILLAVHLVLVSLERDEIIAALSQILAPLGLMRIDHRRCAVRITMTMEAVDKVRVLLEEAIKGRDRQSLPLTQIRQVAGQAFRDVIQESTSIPCGTVTIPAPRPVSLWL